MSRYIDKDCIEYGVNTKYNLFALSNHSGAIEFGHYYSDCKIEDQWFEFNDSKVKLDSLNKESSNVYALFFERSESNY